MKNTILGLLLKILDITDGYFAKNINHIILNYHNIANKKEKYSISKKNFIKQLDYIKERYKLSEISNFFNSKHSSKTHIIKILITFDDALKSVLSLKSYIKINRIKPVIFVSPALLGKRLNNLSVMSMSQLKELKKDKWVIGFHGKNHINLTKIEDDKKLKSETECGDFSKKIGYKIPYFAYPFGKYNKKVINILKNYKYMYCFTSCARGFNINDFKRFEIPRINVSGFDDLIKFKIKISPTYLYIKNMFLQ